MSRTLSFPGVPQGAEEPSVPLIPINLRPSSLLPQKSRRVAQVLDGRRGTGRSKSVNQFAGVVQLVRTPAVTLEGTGSSPVDSD